ncbi:hypothetical protein HY643_01525 [Candidatus Woesearchaeota archaeon]|nr:hypothetical protein [Candidatus Woesearchaeota archaeon]
MKLYSKIGIGIAATTLALAAPSLAQSSATIKTQIQETGKINESELRVKYAQKLEEIAKDGVIRYKEAVELCGVLTPYFSGEIKDEDAPKEVQSQVMSRSEMAKTIEEKIFKNYPGLISEKDDQRKINIVYPSNQLLKDEEKKILTDLVNNNPSYTTLSIIKEKDGLNITDLVRIYSELKDRETTETIQPGGPIVNFKDLNTKDIRLTYSLLKEYANETEEYKQKMSKFIGYGTLVDAVGAVDRGVKDDLIDAVRKQLQQQVNINISTRMNAMHIPKRGCIPWLPFYITIPLGIAAPIGRVIFMKRLAGRQLDLFDVTETTISTALGSLALDSLHPLVYPTRIIAPIFFEAIRKATGWRS